MFRGSPNGFIEMLPLTRLVPKCIDQVTRS
jgi:hypothetical protein